MTYLLYKRTQRSLRLSPTKLSHAMTSEIPKISGDCRKIKLQNFSILRYYSSVCATHSCLRCNKLFKTAFYSLSIKNLCLSSLRCIFVLSWGSNEWPIECDAAAQLGQMRSWTQWTHKNTTLHTTKSLYPLIDSCMKCNVIVFLWANC